MRLGEYPIVLWEQGDRDPVKLIREIHYYLEERFGQAFVPDTYAGWPLTYATAS